MKHFLALLILPLLASNTPPPPFTDPVTTTTNALGGVAQTLACTEAVGVLQDIAGTPKWGNATCDVSGLTAQAAAQARVYTVKMLATDAANGRICVGLAPSTPNVGCTDTNVTGSGLGCTLINAGDFCQYTVRPQVSGCTSWGTCHLPIWAAGSASHSAASLVEVSVTQ